MSINRPPDDFWREVPCGHPSDPVAWWTGEVFSCHCGKILEPARKIMVIDAYDIVQCGGCGCAVGCDRTALNDGRPTAKTAPIWPFTETA